MDKLLYIGSTVNCRNVPSGRQSQRAKEPTPAPPRPAPRRLVHCDYPRTGAIDISGKDIPRNDLELCLSGNIRRTGIDNTIDIPILYVVE